MSGSPADREFTRVLLVCGAVEVVAWVVAWLRDFSILPLAGAIAISLGVGGVIVAMQLRKRQSGS